MGSEPALAARLLQDFKFRLAQPQRPDRDRAAHRHQSPRLQHGAQRLDVLLDGADPQEQQAGRFGAPSQRSVGAQHRGGRIRLRARQELHQGQSRRSHAHRHDARHRQIICVDARDRSSGAVRQQHHAEPDHRRVACVHRQGHSRKLEFLRGHGAGGRRSGGFQPNRGRAARFERCRCGGHTHGFPHRGCAGSRAGLGGSGRRQTPRSERGEDHGGDARVRRGGHRAQHRPWAIRDSPRQSPRRRSARCEA